jgi:hypothetical protein
VVPVTFQLNLAPQIARGTFDPATATASVAGDFNAWDTAAAPLTQSTTNTNLWTATVDITGATGTTLLYKFVLNGGTWEAGNNRTYTLVSTSAQNVPVAFFDGVDNTGRLAVTSATGGRLTLSWTAGPLIRLQRTADLPGGPWVDVPGTEGKDSATVDVTGERAFYRLVGP